MGDYLIFFPQLFAKISQFDIPMNLMAAKSGN